MNSEFASITEAARLKNVSRMLLSRRVRDGQLPYFLSPMDTRVRLVRLADVEALMTPRPANREQTAEVAAA